MSIFMNKLIHETSDGKLSIEDLERLIEQLGSKVKILPGGDVVLRVDPEVELTERLIKPE